MRTLRTDDKELTCDMQANHRNFINRLTVSKMNDGNIGSHQARTKLQ